jgi:hypothetical protein
MAALDQMDFLMHQPDTAGSTPGSNFHGLPQHQGCPYFRNQQQHHGSSLPPPHFDPGFHPMAHQLPHLSQLSHTGHPSSGGPGSQNRPGAFPSAVPGGNHGQQQHQQQPHQQHQQQTHPQTQPQSQPPSQPQQQLPPIQPPTLPYPQPYSHPHSSHHSSHYDPVHAANAAWFQNQNQGNPWLVHTFHPPGHSHSNSNSNSNSNSHHANHHTHHAQHSHHTPTTQFPHSRPSATDSHFGSPGSGPSVVPPLHQFPSHYEPYPPPFHYPGYQRPATHQRSSISLPTPPQLSNDQANRQDHADENHPSQHSQTPDSHSPPVAMSADRGAPPPDRRGFTLPALNPNSTQPSSGSQPNPQAASSSREPSPPDAATPAELPALIRHHNSLTSSNRETPDTQAAATPTPQLPLPSDYPTMDYNNRGEGHMRSTHSSLAPGRGQSAIPPNPSLASITARRRQAIARRMRPTDHDSDEDLGSSADEEEQMLRYMDEFGGNQAHFRSLVAEDHIRATQLLRGQLSNKRVASRKALSSLQSVNLDSLSPTERTCVICYNDFGQTSPEGVIEAPLRLPKCQHVFGDHCIKKWFEEADSCPYCRDKVPSELAPVPGARAFHNLIRMRNHIPQGNASSAAAAAAADESIFRILTQHEHQDPAVMDAAMDFTRARVRARQEGAGSDNIAPRPSQRRSPPSEAENRRRTRVRHSSFHPSHPSGMFIGGPLRTSASGYQSSTRERSSMPGGQRMFYNPVDPGHPSNAAPQPDQTMPSLTPSSPNIPTGNAAHLHMLSGNNHGYYPNMAFGNALPPSFSHQLPPLSTPNFENAAGSSNGAPSTGGAESQMQ